MRAMNTFFGTAALLMVATCLPVYGAEIQTYAGPQTVENTPAKIAVLDIAAIDTLDALGVTIAGVPNSLYLERLQAKYAKAEVVGTLFEPDLEVLNALAPDLIVVGGRSSGKQTETSRVAPSIDMTIWGEDLTGQVRQRILDYGRIFDLNDKAQTLVSEFDHKIETAKNALEGKGTALILMTNGPKISVYGPGSRFGWIHSVLGLPAADPNIDASNHGDAVSFEYVAETDPDWLIVVDRAAAVGSNEQNAEATLDNALIRQTKAWKTGQVVYLPSASVYIAAGGAQATVEVIDSLIDGFSEAQ